MKKFCTNCGKELNGETVCECQKEISENEFLKEILEIIKNIFRKPIDTIRENTIEENFNISLIFMGFLSVISGLFAITLVKEMQDLISYLFVSGSYYMGPSVIEINYGIVFLIAIMATFILSFIFTGILYLVNTIIFKGKANFKTIYSLCGVVSIVMSATLAGVIFISFINLYFSLIILILGLLLCLVYIYSGFKIIGPKDENKYGYIYLVTMVFYYIAVFMLMMMFVLR